MALFDVAANEAWERRSPEDREAALFARLRSFVARAQTDTPHYAKSLDDIAPESLTDRAALATLPVLYKSDLIDLQDGNPPFGGLTAVPAAMMRRMFLSPGPIAEPQARHAVETDDWRMARALHAAWFTAGVRVLNCFSYHLTPAGLMLDQAAGVLGAGVFPGGVGNTEAQVQAISRLNLNAYMGTPDFLKVILERADELNTDVSSMVKALVTGGPLFPHLREWYTERGVAVRQCYGSAELGLVAYEGAGPSDGMVIDEDVIVEIVRPGTEDPVAEGEVGEVVVTTFEPHYPLIRLATGDLSALLPGHCPSGRTNVRLKGWMGRADQTTKVRGLFVHPRQIASSVALYSEVTKARLVVTEVDSKDQMQLHCEVKSASDDLRLKLEETLRVETRLRGEVVFVEPGKLANDGKVIDDQRTSTT